MTTKLITVQVFLKRYWIIIQPKHFSNKYIKLGTIAVSKKEQSANHVSTSTTASNIAGINNMMIFEAKFSLRKKKPVIEVE